MQSGAELKDDRGARVPFHAGEDTLTFMAELPSLGYALFRLAPDTGCGGDGPQGEKPAGTLIFHEGVAESPFFRLELDSATGDLNYIEDRQKGTPLCGGPSFALELHDEDEKATSWVQVLSGRRRRLAMTVAPHVIDRSPFHMTIASTSQSRWSKVTREMVLYSDMRRIDFRLDIDWQDSGAFLKLGFTPATEGLRLTTSLAHGYEEIPEGSGEFCCHDWVYVGDEKRGLAFFNDGLYGADFSGGRLGLSIIRTARDMDPVMSFGRHELRASLAPIDGPYRQSAVHRELLSFLAPPLTRWESEHPGGLMGWSGWDKGTAAALPSAGSFLTVDNPNVAVCAFKSPEEYYMPQAFVIRLRELDGTGTTCTLRLPLACRALWRADHLERPVRCISENAGAVFHPDIKPYEILTLIAYVV